ncbi:MAG: hypothetical protein ACH346_02855 [Chthoniobacterales bacterium]
MKKIALLLSIGLVSVGLAQTDITTPNSDPTNRTSDKIGMIITPPPPINPSNPNADGSTDPTTPRIPSVPNQAVIVLYGIPTDYQTSMNCQTPGAPDFCIAATCVSTRQYCAFLNAVAQSGDPYGLYYQKTPFQKGICLIKRNNYLPPFYYTLDDGILTIPGAFNPDGTPYTILGGEYPMTYVSLLSAARFCNWIANGEPTNLPEGPGSTETGSYTITTSKLTTNAGTVMTNNSPILNTISLNPGAHWRLLGSYPSSNTNIPGNVNGIVNEWRESLASFQAVPQDQGALVYQWMDTRIGINPYNGWLQISTCNFQTRTEGINSPLSETGFRLVYFP